MSDPAISVRNLSKCYQLGTIGRHTLVDECQYLWHKLRGRDPRQHMTKIGHTATEARKIEAEQEGSQEFWALKDVSFDVQPGEVVGIIGRNGAGKSTLLKLLTRITEPTSGEVVMNGRVASLLEVGTGFHPELTGRENVYMNGTILGMKKREIDAKFDEIVSFSELEKFVDTPVKRYSSGMYVRLAFAVAAHLEPEIMLVDEVLAVGDSGFQKKCLGKMGEVAKQGRTVLFVSHNMAAIENLCPKAIWLQDGKVNLAGLSSNVIQTYLDRLEAEVGLVSLKDRNDRQGSGRAKIIDFFVEDLDGARQSALRAGRSYRFCMVCNLKDDAVPLGNVVGSIALSGSRNETIWLVRSNFSNENLLLDRSRVVVRCTVNDFNIAEGVYFTTLFLAAGETEILDCLTHATKLSVEAGDYFGSGSRGLPSLCPVLTRSRWGSTPCD